MSQLVRLSRLLLLVIVLGFIGLYISAAVPRLAYPFELESTEGSSLVEIARILDGRPLYVRPSFEFIPLIYTPLYFYVSAAFASVLGVSFLPLRFVSFAASLISLALIFAIIRREGAGRLPAIIGAGLYAATYALSLGWYDLGRVDSLLVMWLLLAIYLMRSGTRRGLALAGLTLSLAWLTKQTSAAAIIVLEVYALLAWRRRALIMIGITLSSIGIVSFIWNMTSAGWFNYYIFYLPTMHTLSLSLRTAVGFLLVDGVLLLPIACLFSLWWLVWPTRSAVHPATRLFYVASAMAFVGLAFLSRINLGASQNALMPEFAMFAILLGLGLGLGLTEKRVAQLPPPRSSVFQAAIYGLILAQFLALFYWPAGMIPTEQDRQAGEQLVELIETTPGEVFVAQHGYLALQAGKNPYAHAVSLSELGGTFGTQPVAEWADITNQMRTAIHSRIFSLIILDQPGWMQADLEQYYTIAQDPIFTDERVFRPVVGWPARPEIVYAPNPK
jgi:4-amino-4-deoxy-L-arabinose transferase-like glycosyltransferase